MQDHTHLLHAKIALLESMIVFLTMREIVREPDPMSAAETMAANFRAKVEAKADEHPDDKESEIAHVIGFEVVDSFFDRVKSAVAASQRE
jgi:hypothetical protein